MIRSNKFPKLGRFKYGIAMEGPNPFVASSWMWIQSNTVSFSLGNLIGPGATADKITYATETTAATVGANLSLARYGAASTGNNTFGVSQGGGNGSTRTTADKTTYATSTTAAQSSADLPAARCRIISSGDLNAAYAFGGETTINAYGNTNLCYKTPYGTLTCAANANGNLGINLGNGGYHSSGIVSYVIGGYKDGSTRNASAYKMPFATETTAAVAGANASVAKGETAGFTGGETVGYTTGDAAFKTYDRTNYATDTNTALSQTIPSTATNGPSGHSSSTVGYQLGGYDTNFGNKAYKMPLSTETVAAIAAMNKSVTGAISFGCG
jgi:hypothetical protein